MMTMLAPQTLIDELGERNAKALELAEIVSLAARIEPELLRAARLAMPGAADAAAEADVWLSSIVSSRSALFAVMRKEAGDILRQRLATSTERLNLAWKVLARIHENAPPALRVEEEITWRVLTNPDDPEIGRLFESVISAMEGGRAGLAKWAARALPRMPALAKQSVGAWRVAQKAVAMLGGQPILTGDLTRTSMHEVAPAFNLAGLSKREIGLRLFEDALRISEPAEPEEQTIAIPETVPLVLEVEWRGKSGNERRVVSFGAGSSQLVRPIDTAWLRITNAALEAFVVEALGAEQHAESPFTQMASAGGLTGRTYRGDGVVLLAFDLAAKLTGKLAGFTVERLGHDGVATKLKTTPANEGGQVSHGELPLQRFRCFDRPPSDTPGQHVYRISVLHHESAIRGSAEETGERLATGLQVHVPIDLRPAPSSVEVGFTNCRGTSPHYGPLKPAARTLNFDTALYAERYQRLGGNAHRIMAAFLEACVNDPRSAVDVFAFDFDHPDILKSFVSLGPRLRIVLDDSPVHKNRQYELMDRLTKARCQVQRAHFRGMSHNKLIIRNIDGRPSEVLTGSANFSINSLYAQQNYVIAIHNSQVASLYAGYFNEALRGEVKMHSWASINEAHVPRMRVLMCPSDELISEVRRAMASAKSSILFSLSALSSRAIIDELKKLGGSFNNVLVGGVLHSNSGQKVRWGSRETAVGPSEERRKLTSTTSGASAGNGKFVVIDFNQPGAVVYAGSSSFSDRSATINGDNVLAIHDPAFATQFALEALQMIDHYRFRARPGESTFSGLDSTDGWWRRYYLSGDVETLGRRILANAPYTQEPADGKRSRARPAEKTTLRRPLKKKSKK